MRIRGGWISLGVLSLEFAGKGQEKHSRVMVRVLFLDRVWAAKVCAFIGRTPFPIWKQSVVPCLGLTVAS